MKNVSSLLIMFCLAACLRKEKQDNQILNRETEELQRIAMWHRQYYLEVLKWADRNRDSIKFYQAKADSMLQMYKLQMRRYDSLTKLYNK